MSALDAAFLSVKRAGHDTAVLDGLRATSTPAAARGARPGGGGDAGPFGARRPHLVVAAVRQRSQWREPEATLRVEGTSAPAGGLRRDVPVEAEACDRMPRTMRGHHAGRITRAPPQTKTTDWRAHPRTGTRSARRASHRRGNVTAVHRGAGPGTKRSARREDRRIHQEEMAARQEVPVRRDASAKAGASTLGVALRADRPTRRDTATSNVRKASPREAEDRGAARRSQQAAATDLSRDEHRMHSPRHARRTRKRYHEPRPALKRRLRGRLAVVNARRSPWPPGAAPQAPPA